MELEDEGASLWGEPVDVYGREDGRLLAYRVESQSGPGGDSDHALRSPVVRNVYPNMADAIVNPNLGLYTAHKPGHHDKDQDDRNELFERYYERWVGSGAPPPIGADDAGRLEPLADDYKYIEDMPIFDLEGKGVLVTFDRGNDNWVQVKDEDGNDVMFDSPDPNQTNQMRLERIQMVVVVEEKLNGEPVYVLTGERVEKTNQDLMNHDWSGEEGRWVPAPSGRVVFERTIYSDPETGSYYTKMVHSDPEGNEHVNWERARLHGLPVYEDGDGKVYEYDEFTKLSLIHISEPTRPY